MDNINHTHPRHCRRTVHERQALTQIDLKGFYATRGKHLACGTKCTVNQDLPLSYEVECQVSKLNEVATGTNTAALKNAGRDLFIEEFFQQFYCRRVDTGISLHQAIQAREHRGTRQVFRHGRTCARAVAPDEVVL